MSRSSKKEQQRLEAERLRKFTVTDASETVTWEDPEMGATLTSVVEGLVNNFQGPNGPGFEADFDGSHFGGVDMAVWQHDRLVAVVRKGPDGKPQSIVF